MERTLKRNQTAAFKRGILQHLLYSEVFAHPLNQEELIRFSGTDISVSFDELHEALDQLKQDGLVLLHNNHACLFSVDDKIERRSTASNRANELFDRAVRVSKFIQKFPFVEGVGISGSLSKGILHDDGDFDFFIIVKPNRVWVARTLLILYKKVFLLNSRKYFCVNYFIDSDHLEIEEKNRFTAVEVATLIPAAGDVFDDFYKANTWVNDFFPGNGRTEFKTNHAKKPVWSKILQGVFKGKLGNWADRKAMKMTIKRWRSKFGDFDDEKFELTMKSRRYVSKHHPNDFQNKVLTRYEELRRTFVKTNAEALTKQGIEL